MAVTRYTTMAYDKADDMVFGFSQHPLSYGFGLKVGAPTFSSRPSGSLR